jgi:hypothetical protein
VERAVSYNAATFLAAAIGVAILHIGLFILLLVTDRVDASVQMACLPTFLMMARLVVASVDVVAYGGHLGAWSSDSS